MAAVRYAELHCISNFTFLRGASHPGELVERAAKLDYHALAITDECSVAGMVRAHIHAEASDLKLIVGSEFALHNGARCVLLAQDRMGYGNLCELITRGRRQAKKGQYRLTYNDLQGRAGQCLALWLPNPRAPDPEELKTFSALFPRQLWIAVELLNGGADGQQLECLTKLGKRFAVPLVAAGDVHMHVRARRYLQDTLTAIRLKRPLRELGYELHPNGERHLRPPETLARLYPPELLEASVEIAERCTFRLRELRYEYPHELVPPGHTPTTWLRELVGRGIRRRWRDGVPNEYRPLIEKELALIEELHYEPFFLTVHDVVEFAREQGILCQGRGSAANSLVCYCLGVTEVSPDEVQMLFERFVSKERNEPPDIDIDFEHQRREEVLQYIYRKYGRERAALAATVITYQTRSAVRDIGKALGLAPAQLDQLSAMNKLNYSEEVPEQRLREGGFDPQAPVMRRLRHLAAELHGFPRHLSQHVGGMVISQGPIDRLVAVENASMADRTVIQWDKDDLEALALLKVDCLALGMLTALRRSFHLIADFYGRPIGLADIPQNDDDTYAMIQRADTVGVFQIESRAQMIMLPRLKPKNYYDLVVEIAIIRPGPIQGGMVHPYLRRRRGEEPVEYPDPSVEHVLERTLGIPLFQEQVMQLAIIAAGFSPGEADQLRRSMAAWKRNGSVDKFRRRFIDGMLQRSYSLDLAERLFEQIKGFSGYGFPESHSASFALLAYASSWLKCHYPAVYCAALLNSQPMGFYQPAQLVQDAERHGVEARPPSIGDSDWQCTLERRVDGTPALRLGLRMVKGLSEQAARRIETARAERSFTDVDDLSRRAALTRGDLNALARADALCELAGHRRQATWGVLGLHRHNDPLRHPRPAETNPQLAAPRLGEEVIDDYGTIGLSLRAHPLQLIRGELDDKHLSTLAQVRTHLNGQTVRTAGLVINRQRPSTAKGTVFVTLEDETDNLNVIVPKRVQERQRSELLGSRLLLVAGVIEKDGLVVQCLAKRLEDLSYLLGRLPTKSRDFH